MKKKILKMKIQKMKNQKFNIENNIFINHFLKIEKKLNNNFFSHYLYLYS